MPKLAGDTKRKQLDGEFFSEFSPSQSMFLKKLDFPESDITDSELQYVLSVLFGNNDVFSTLIYELGKITKKFHPCMKKDAKLRKQRPSKVPLHYRNCVENVLKELQQAGIIRKKGSDVEMCSLFTNPIIILQKGDTVEMVIDARYLNTNIDFSKYSWPLAPVQMLMISLNGAYDTTKKLASVYNQVPLSQDTNKVTSFVVGGTQYMFGRGF